MQWRTPFTALLTVPASLALVIAALAWVAVLCEDAFGTPRWLMSLDAASAHTILSVVATGAMTALALAYSLTLVVFTLAASSIGPRLLKRFTTERANQVTAGLLGGTFLYAIIALGLSGAEVPRLATVGAGMLAIASVVQLIWFVRTVAQSVSIDDELAKIAARLERDLTRLKDNSALSVELPDAKSFHVAAKTVQAGYLAQIDRDALVRLAKAEDIVVQVGHTPGEYLFEGAPVISVSRPVDEQTCESLQTAVRQEPARSDAGTVHFSLNLLVEIALRALSPGVNDTFTALAVSDMLSGALAGIAQTKPRPEVILDEAGRPRVISPGASIRRLFDQAFSPLRRAAATNILMAEGLARAYQRLFDAGNSEAREVVAEHVEILMFDLARTGHHDADIAVVKKQIPAIVD
ncbi:DUF2254 domain-containing protein [Defluviimonas sp. WL0024]|uniref:DUF2254 domain-containing protein n=1 Tax=Albidovulum salinarum TaxID=2984153 RepID=A0ABT2X8F0_9RHOB|nr:DUF2254 domain-containing protein [Defluviimonas sp. WL0024]MCU9850228.1 DUF2254 domain-containing protein [Defluviimonas sp. WL0024]